MAAAGQNKTKKYSMNDEIRSRDDRISHRSAPRLLYRREGKPATADCPDVFLLSENGGIWYDFAGQKADQVMKTRNSGKKQ
jgi:hypothetical protein